MKLSKKIHQIFALRHGTPDAPEPLPEQNLDRARERMIHEDLDGRGIKDRRVLEAMRRVPREEFIPAKFAAQAYEDTPLEIGYGQTISQPYIVARMTELIDVQPGDAILEIGLGCGYQTAILLELGAEVLAVEIVPELARASEERLTRLGYGGFRISCHDGHRGWPDHAPYDSILMAAVAPQVPESLWGQAKLGARLVAPIGKGQDQILHRWVLGPEGWTDEKLFPVRFVPMTGGGSTFSADMRGH